MLRNNWNNKLQEILFIEKQSPIRKLESNESRFLWKNGSYSRTTWKTFVYHQWYTYHRLGTPDLYKWEQSIMLNLFIICFSLHIALSLILYKIKKIMIKSLILLAT